MKALTFCIIVFVLSVCSFTVNAATITSKTTGGSWTTGTTWVGDIAPATGDDVVIATTDAGEVTISEEVSCASLTINSGSILTVRFTFNVNGTTSISGTLNFDPDDYLARTITLTGDITLSSGARWTESNTNIDGGPPVFIIKANFTNNATSFTALTDLHRFAGTSKIISGTTGTTIPWVQITGTYTNNSELTVTTSLSGGGGLTNGATGILNLGGTTTITTLTATAIGNTVNYTGASQTLKVIPYHHLILSGGAETFGAITTIAGNLTLSGSATASTGGNLTVGGNLTIGSGTTFSVSAGDFVTVTGALSNSQTLNLLSASGGTASLLTGSVSGAGTTNVERYITGGAGNVWHNLSSSVSGYSISSFIGNAANSIPNKGSNPIIYGMEYYDEPNGVWTYFTSANIEGAGNLEPGQGYLVRRDPSGVVTFSGLLDSGNISLAALRTHFGWNSVGNPYPSSIALNTNTGVTNFLDVNSANLFPSFVGAYFWSGTTYTLINNSDAATYLQPGQGFVVKVAVGNSDIDFTPAMQSHGNPNFLKKSSGSPFDEIRLNVNKNSDTLYTILRFRDDMTKGLDISYDGGLFRGDTLFRLSTQLLEDNGYEFMIQCLPSIETDSMCVPVGLNCLEGGLISFTADIKSLPAGYISVLEDRQLGIFTDLGTPGSKYELSVPEGTKGNGRFFLHTVEGPNGFKLPNYQKITTFAVKKEIFIRGNITEDCIVSVYDLLGRKISDSQLEPTNLNIINASSLKAGIYIVKVSGKGVSQTNRVLISD